MISIKKCENISEIGFNTPLEAYMLFEDCSLKLACVFELHKNKTRIFDIKTFSDVQKLYYDAIIRTVAAYSLSKGVELAVSDNINISDVLVSLGFTENNAEWSAKNSLLVAHQCGDR